MRNPTDPDALAETVRDAFIDYDDEANREAAAALSQLVAQAKRASDLEAELSGTAIDLLNAEARVVEALRSEPVYIELLQKIDAMKDRSEEIATLRQRLAEAQDDQAKWRALVVTATGSDGGIPLSQAVATIAADARPEPADDTP